MGGAKRYDAVTEKIIAAAIQVHRELGPGLLESTYEACLEHQLLGQGQQVQRQVGLPVCYQGITLHQGYRVDLIVERTVIVEIKSVEAVTELHCAQTRSYLKLSRLPVALLINFNCRLLKQGLRRFLHPGNNAESATSP